MNMFLINLRSRYLYSLLTIAIFVASVFLYKYFLFSTPIPTVSTELPAITVDENRLHETFYQANYYFSNSDGKYDLTKARAYFEAGLAASSTADSSAWYQLGRIDFLEGKFDAAIVKFDNQVKYFGESIPAVHYMAGLTYGYRAKELGDEADWQKAEEEFLVYLKSDPESPWARTDLAWIYFAQGKFNAMLPLLAQGLEYKPDSPWLHNMYGLALLNTGNKESAKTHFEKAKEQADLLTAEDWGSAYPGNNPEHWPVGLQSFRDAIAKNLALAS